MIYGHISQNYMVTQKTDDILSMIMMVAMHGIPIEDFPQKMILDIGETTI